MACGRSTGCRGCIILRSNYSQAHRASDDLFLLVIEANDPKFDAQAPSSICAVSAPAMWRWWKDEALEDSVRRSCALPRSLLLSGCSSVQRDTPMQVWDDMKHQQKFKAQAPVVGHFRRRPLQPPASRRHGAAQRDTATIRPTTRALKTACTWARTRCRLRRRCWSKGRPSSTSIARRATIRPAWATGSCPTHVPIWQPSNLTEDRVVQFADGDIFNVITNGRRTMPPYRYPSGGR